MKQHSMYLRRARHILHRPHTGFPGYTPEQIVRAYNMDVALQGVSLSKLPILKIGIISLGGQPTPLATVQSAFVGPSGFDLPVPQIDYISLPGADTSSDPQGANVENDLDTLWAAGIWSACTGLPAHIVFISAPNSPNGIAQAAQAAADAGCSMVSCSWGSAFQTWSASSVSATQTAGAYCQARNCYCQAASGDNSADDNTSTAQPDGPSCFLNWFGVGGTRLTLNQDGSRGTESGWGDGSAWDEGGGGGINSSVMTPVYQSAVMSRWGQGKGDPDWSCPADPDFGGAVLTGGSWTSVGGTSWACPTSSAWQAVCMAVAMLNGLTPASPVVLYTGASADMTSAAFNDITTGSDGNPAVAGYDLSSGLGTPDGPAYLSLYLKNCTPGGTTVPPTNPTPPTTPTQPTQPTVPAGMPVAMLGFASPVHQGQLVMFAAPRSWSAGEYGVFLMPSGQHRYASWTDIQTMAGPYLDEILLLARSLGDKVWANLPAIIIILSKNEPWYQKVEEVAVLLGAGKAQQVSQMYFHSATIGPIGQFDPTGNILDVFESRLKAAAPTLPSGTWTAILDELLQVLSTLGPLCGLPTVPTPAQLQNMLQNPQAGTRIAVRRAVARANVRLLERQAAMDAVFSVGATASVAEIAQFINMSGG